MHITSYAWDFGDGATGTGVIPTHTYTELGTYTLTLTVKDAASNEATDTLTVTVETLFPWWILGVVLIVGFAVILGFYSVTSRKTT